MPAVKSKKNKDPFLSLALQAQCDELGIPLKTLQLQKSEKSWIFEDKVFTKPEPAAYAYFKSHGFNGNFCEGSAPLMLLKCASLNFLAKENTFNDRSDACLRYFEAQCAVLNSKINLIVNEIRNAKADEIRKHFNEIHSHELYSTLYPEMSVDGLLAIWHTIGASGWANIAEHFAADPYTFRAGWPDLSLASGEFLHLVEVKTSDKLHSHQQITFSKLLIPIGLHVSVIKLTQPNHSLNTAPFGRSDAAASGCSAG